LERDIDTEKTLNAAATVLRGRHSMKTRYTMTLAMLAGCGLGAAAVQGLHAQAKPPIYYVVEIDTTNPDAYAKEFAPQAQAIIKAAGGRFVAIGGVGATGAKSVTEIEGEPPKRVVVMAWDTMEQIKAWWGNPEYAALRKVVDKYAKFRSYAVEGQ
jgi:uncharacterized protein (DUF1330 family)